jgi:RNA polymerase sigma-70 factor (ECF subfamily)
LGSSGSVSAHPDEELLAALRAGDEGAFVRLVDAYGAGMRRFALSFVRTPALADEVVQEAWLALLHGLDRFEGRSSLKTWLYRVVANIAQTQAVREARTIPLSAFDGELEGRDAAAPAGRFEGAEAAHPGRWLALPRAWNELHEHKLEAAETRAVIASAIELLPLRQRQVVSLRDIEGYAASEVCNILDISETNQRVLLHRARSSLRAALDAYFAEGAWTPPGS